MAPSEYWQSLSTRMRAQVKIAAVYLGCGVALLTFLNLMPMVWRNFGLPAFATETAVEQRIDARVKPLTEAVQVLSSNFSDSTIESAEFRRAWLDESIAKWNGELAKTQDPTLRNMIEGQIAQLANARISAQIKLDRLNRERFGPH